MLVAYQDPISVLTFLSIFGWHPISSSSCSIVPYWFFARIIAHANCAMNPIVSVLSSVGTIVKVLGGPLRALFCRILKARANFAIST